MLVVKGDYVEYVYKGAFRYDEFCSRIWPSVSKCIRFPPVGERDPDYESIWEDVKEEDCREMAIDMLDRMGLASLDGKSGFVFVDEMGYVECMGEIGDDGKRYCTLSLPVDGVLCIRPEREEGQPF